MSGVKRRRLLKLAGLAPFAVQAAPVRRTAVSIRGDQFLINGKPTYAGRSYKGLRIEGLLMNNPGGARLSSTTSIPKRAANGRIPTPANGIRNATSASFLAALPEWAPARPAGVHDRFPGGSPEKLLQRAAVGEYRHRRRTAACVRRTWIGLARVLDRADELGMVAIVGYFYFRPGPACPGDEAAVKRAVVSATRVAARPRLSQRAGGDRQRRRMWRRTTTRS